MSPEHDAAALLRANTAVLRLAARLFAREVDAPLYGRMLATDIRWGTGHPLVDAPDATRDEAVILEDMAAEFCRLFIGPQPVCPPYASAWHGEVKLGGRPAHAVEALMVRHGVRPVIDSRDAVLEPDHISVELALLAHFREAAAADPTRTGERAAVRELLEQHIRPWSDGFLERVADAARMGPYEGIAVLLWNVLDDSTVPTASRLP
ncbi:TorD/DmsD family molecular chaperone [Actinokineospora fastidiosa]|uniref:Uncharacterized protein n=1 Tax=Actinokineospora fastidiosa TaxID=1816 RepID=A0A918LBF9_9PSEU|nr:molecular chaperone TorD family protein [Actinokineospora fastidiosa]GGS28887.1 hypothetical protein GCM10010171_22550 [Actinokineospora fastidiosa]